MPESAQLYVQYGGAFGIVLVLLLQGVLRLGREYEEMRRDRDMWRRIALEGNEVAGHAVEVAELAASKQ